MRERECALLLGPLLLLQACSPPASPAWSGYAEGEYVYLASAVAGHLQALPVQRGQHVQAGAPLFVLDAEFERGASAEARARVEAAQAQAANAAKGKRRDEVDVVQAQLAQARAQALLAQQELERLQPLLDQGFIAASRLDGARAAALAAQARVNELGASLQVSQLPARIDEQRAAHAQGEAARQGLQQTLWREQQKQRQAPTAAWVADTYFRPGEWVPAGQPVLALLPDGRVKLRFFVPESDIAGLSRGQVLSVTCDGCGEGLRARVAFIATQAEYTPPVIYSNAQRSKLVFMVEAWPEGVNLERLKPGLPVDLRRVAS